MNNNAKTVKEIFSEDEIALSDLFHLFYSRRKVLYITVGVFLVIGILVALTSPVEYTAESKILSESQQQSNSGVGGLAGIAGLAGIQLPQINEQASLSPAMYPEIVSSEPFLKGLMQERFYFQEKDAELSLFEYFSEERPGHMFSKIFDFLRSIPSRFFSLLEKKKEWQIPSEGEVMESEESNGTKRRLTIQNTTPAERYVMTQLESRIEIEGEGRMIILSVRMPEPYISAQLNTIVFEKIIEYVVAYQTDKQRENLNFVEARTKEAEANFKKSQLKLADFRDSNQGQMSARASAREEQLQAEYNLAFNLFNSLAQQLEQLRIQLKKDTPLFTEFEPVVVPTNNSEPNIPKVFLIYIAMGVILGSFLIFIKLIRSYLGESD
ncbi:MAG: Wzz/FepE/Etk N-terminal domain-containing protein [Cyclobacteriaceae bacterium]